MDSQPLHNRLALLWTSAQNAGALPVAARKAIVAETLGKQNSDGGWTLTSIGPWKEHAGAPASEGSNAYATAIATLALSKALPRSDAALGKAMRWLETHQDREGGYWDAMSMNKKYPAGSMESLFMRDAATAFAVLALTGGERD
jgi:hypothetical protein